MTTILRKCLDLDLQYQEFVNIATEKSSELSQVSQEFVSAKLEFLNQYSEGLTQCNYEAKQYRNQQVKNLIAYIQLHSRRQTPSQSRHFGSGRTTKTDKSDFQDKIKRILKPKSENISFALIQQCQTPTNSNSSQSVLKQLMKKHYNQKQQNEQRTIKLLEKCLNIIKQNGLEEYEELEYEYTNIFKKIKMKNQQQKLQSSSKKVKEKIQILKENQESFKQFLLTAI